MKSILLFSIAFLLTGGSYAQIPKISKQAAISDIDYLVQTLEEVHYNPYLFIDKKTFSKKVDLLKTSLPDSLTANRFIVSLYKLTAAMQDGHTMPYLVQPSLLPELRKEQFLYLPLARHGERLFICKSDSLKCDIPPGAEVISINGRSVPKLLSEFESCFGGYPDFKKEISTRFFSYLLFLKGIAPPFDIVYSTGVNKTKHRLINTGSNFKEALVATMPHLVKEYDFRIVNDKVAYLNFMSMGGSLDNWGGFLDSVFSEIRNRQIKTLAIDIRNNPGGNSNFNNYLLAYITQKAFKLSGEKCWKISQLFKDYQQQNGSVNPEYMARAISDTWCFGDCIPVANPATVSTVYDGKVYLLTGPFTFSSANMLADAAKTYSLATIIGTPTGEYTNDFGEMMQVTLPATNIKMQVTTSFDFGADCDKAKRTVVIPDISVKQSLPDKISNKDVLLQYIADRAE